MNNLRRITIVLTIFVVVLLFILIQWPIKIQFIGFEVQTSEDLPQMIDQKEQLKLRINEQLEQLKIEYANLEPIAPRQTNFTSSCQLTAKEQEEIEINYLEHSATTLEIFMQLCPTRLHIKDNGDYISKDEWDIAVSHIFKNLDGADLSLLEDVAEGNRLWWVKHHDFVGEYIRNILRNEGIDWGDKALENYWYELVEDATTRVGSDILGWRIKQEKIKHGYKPIFARAK